MLISVLGEVVDGIECLPPLRRPIWLFNELSVGIDTIDDTAGVFLVSHRPGTTSGYVRGIARLPILLNSN